MTIKVDECVGCPPEMGCLGKHCPKKGYKEVCDECREGDEQLYVFGGKVLCINCIEERLEKFEQE